MARTWRQATEALRVKAQDHLDNGRSLSAQAFITAADHLDEVDHILDEKTEIVRRFTVGRGVEEYSLASGPPIGDSLSSEYWIWSNEHGAWWGPAKLGYTRLLHEAGRYQKFMVDEILAKCNLTVAPDAWPLEVAIPVTNGFMTAKAQAIMEAIDEE